MRFISGFILAVVIAVAAGLIVAYGGFFDVAASHPHGPFARWLLDTTMTHAVERDARTVQVPASLPAASAGFSHYDDMCVICHGAPGQHESDLARGLLPPAPDLQKTATEWSDAELFWIIKNGVKMTAMPAWGRTHSDSEIWALVAFLRELPKLGPEQYAAMRQRLKKSATGAAGRQR